MTASFRLRSDRVEAVANALAQPCASTLVDSLESRDVQYMVASEAAKLLGVGEAAVLIVGAALVSYMLTAPGEEHWRMLLEFARRAPNPRRALESFVSSSPSLRLYRKARLSRLEKYFSRFAPALRERLRGYAGDLDRFRHELAKALGTDPNSKTVVFSAKMLYYVLKSQGFDVKVPPSIPVPVDYRVCLVSLTSGVVAAAKHGSLESLARDLRARGAELVRRAWGLVSSGSGVPPLRLDAILWICGGALSRAGLSAEGAVAAVEEFLGRKLAPCELAILGELFKYAPRR